jgi:periplasmic protein CpxP/Spy
VNGHPNPQLGAAEAGSENETRRRYAETTMRNRIMTIALGGLLAIAATSLVYAQDTTSQPQQPPPGQQGQWGGHGRGMDPDRQLEHLTKQLNLTADQQSQIKPILVDRQQKMQALWQNQSLSREDRHSQMETIRQDADSRINAVLNDEQKQKYADMQQRMRPMQGGGNNAPNSNPQPQ